MRVSGLVGMVVDTILPPRCVVSGQEVERQGMLAPEIWTTLDFIAAPFCTICGFPFDFEVDADSQCASCLANPPPYESARAALKYGESSRSLILGFKHADKTYAVKAFLPWMKRAGAEMLKEADMLVPVPLHFWRLVSRRYNQAAIIAHALGAETKNPVVADLLRRTRSTPSQGHLNAKQRFCNVRRAFAVNKKHAETVKDKTIVIIDDVYTTGATVRECAKVLMKAGAKKVHVLTLARVVREGYF